MPISLLQLADLTRKHASPADHAVFVDGVKKGTCTRASFRAVLSPRGFEFPVDYAYELDGATNTLHSRLHREGFGIDGKEQIHVNNADVDNDDVVIGTEEMNGLPAVHVEFRYTEPNGGANRNVRFVAPISAFR